MICPACQRDNSSDARFCEGCGAKLGRVCPACGHEASATAQFCPACGRSFDGTAPAGRLASPQAYTPAHLAERILSSRASLEGERKHVTVLFADLKGSLELLANRDAEEARRLLDPVLERMIEAVHRYEGTVNQVMGDGIMALFGAPLAHEDHAVRACYAALRMQESVRQYADQVQRTEGVPVQIRVGLNSGEVVVRSIGSDLHMDYTAVGQSTHLAARMEQMALPGTILLTADTLRLAEGYVETRALGPVPVKGLAHPVEVYELAGSGPARTRLQVSEVRGLTRFVGRQAELETLHQVLEQARSGVGQLVALVGEPGVGKSRLLREFMRGRRLGGWLTLESSTPSYGSATPYLPVIDLLKTYFRVEARDDARRIRENVTGRLLTLDKTLGSAVPAFLSLLDVAVDDPEWKALNPAQRRQHTLEAIRYLMLRESRVQPLLLVLEDLHWIDAETQAVLDTLVDSLPTARILLLVNYRPEYRHAWASKTYYSQLRIDPLPAAGAGELLSALLGDSRDLAPLRDVLIERTEGNPFFLEESVRALIEDRVLVRNGGAYELAKSPASIRVPPSVQAILAVRIDRLAPEDKRLLQSASVIGKDVPLVLLQAISELPEEELRRALSRLQAAEFLYEANLFPEIEFTFKHALTHEVAYSGLLTERRRALHAQTLAAMEAYAGGRLAEYVERLAHHAVRGEVWDRAVRYLQQSAARAASRASSREAVGLLEQALGALSHLPESRATAEQGIDLRLDMRDALFPLGDQPRIFGYLREAEALAETLGDQSRLGRISSYLTNYFLAVGDYVQAVRSAERALTLAEALGDSALQAATNHYLGQAHLTTGNYRQAVPVLQRNIQALERVGEAVGSGQSALLVLSRSWLLWCLAELGDFAEGMARGEETLRVAAEADDPFDLLLARLGAGLVYLRKGELDQAQALLEDALEQSRDGTLGVWFPAVASPLGYAYALSGRLSDALPLLEQAVEKTVLMRRVGHALRTAHLGEAHLLAGNTRQALDLAERAVELARVHDEQGHLAYALRLLGEVHSRESAAGAEPAAGFYRQAQERAQELGMRPLVGHCELGLGTLHARLGRLPEAREHLLGAVTLFRETGMQLWLERAESALRGPS